MNITKTQIIKNAERVSLVISSKFVCNCCDSLFSELERATSVERHAFGSTTSFEFTQTDVCPECGDCDITELSDLTFDERMELAFEQEDAASSRNAA